MTETTDPYALAVATIPPYVEASKALTAVQKRLAIARSRTLAGRKDLSGEVVAAALAGEDIPEDIGRRAWETGHAGEITAAEIATLATAETALKGSVEQALRTGADSALLVLRDELEAWEAEARPAMTLLRSIESAQDAIDAGPDTVAAWSSMAGLVQRYARIREAQKRLTFAAVGGSQSSLPGGAVISSVLPVWGEIANVTEVWPDWEPGNPEGREERPPWPLMRPQFPFDVHHDREWITWVLTTPGVRLWLPRVGELAKAHQEQLADAHRRGRERRGEIPRTERKEPRPKHMRLPDGSTDSEYVGGEPIETEERHRSERAWSRR